MVRYRLPLFENLRDALDKKGVSLRVLHGSALPAEQKKGDTGLLPWAEDLPTTYVLRDKLCWQPFAKATRGDDLVIITQENRLIANHLALLRPRRNRLAFWGHGANLQRAGYGWKDRYKDWTTRQVDWWFAYTQMSVDLVAQAGFPKDQITCLNNAIDTQKLTSDLDAAAQATRAELLAKYQLSDGRFGLFIGALYEEKRLDFLIDTAIAVRRDIPDFQVLIVGTGPYETALRHRAQGLGFIHFLGPRHGSEKAEVLQLCALVLNPGLVGLGVFDALCAGRPLLTTDCKIHSPEIVYLDPSVGVITDNTQEAYQAAVKDALTSTALQTSAATHGPVIAQQNGIAQMTDRFVTGIEQALG